MLKKILNIVTILLIVIMLIVISRIPCKLNYNTGNKLYENAEYEKAIEKYEKALKLLPTKEQECKIRINLALSMLKRIDNYNENTNKDEIINILKNARNILCEKDCANDKGTGHSKDAEKLKSDIDKMLKKLENQQEEQQDDKNEEKNEENKEEKNENKNYEEKLKQMQRDAIKARIKDQDEDAQYNYTGEYYKGKRW